MVPPFPRFNLGLRLCLACLWYRGLCVPFSGSPCALGRSNQTDIESSRRYKDAEHSSNTHKSDPECYTSYNDLLCEGLNLCPKAYMNNWRIFPVIEIPFLLHKHAVGFGLLKLFICWCYTCGPATKTRLRIWSYPRDAGGSQRMVVWLAFSEHVFWFVDALAHLHLFMGFIHIH